MVSMPDTYRGPHRGHTEASGKKYAKEVAAVIKKLGGGVGAFIHESVMGCGGQIVMPPAYLQSVYSTGEFGDAEGLLTMLWTMCAVTAMQTAFNRDFCLIYSASQCAAMGEL